mgnify:CR=1 FL=1
MLENKSRKLEEDIWIQKTKYNRFSEYYTIEKSADTIMGNYFLIY